MASFQTVPQFFTVLDAVNMCLRTIGTDQVDTVDGTEDADVMAILAELNAADLKVQSNSGTGWAFNSDNSVLLPRAVDGTIPLPAGTLSVCAAYLNTSALTTGAITQVAMRPVGLLYDMVNHTNIFTTPQLVDLVQRMDYETIPQQARQCIALMGAHSFQAQYQGGQIVTQVTSRAVADAWADLQSWDDGANPQNSINANRGVFSRLYGGGGLRRQRGGW